MALDLAEMGQTGSEAVAHHFIPGLVEPGMKWCLLRLLPLLGSTEGGGEGGERRKRPGDPSQLALKGSHDSFTSSRGVARREP
jgi:hypothetical protein